MKLNPGRRSLRAKAIVTLVAATVLLAAAGDVGSQRGPTPPGSVRECTRSERRAVLREEQAKVLARVGRLRVLRNQSDLDALGRAPLNYVFLAHQYTSFRGIGLTIINTVDTPRLGVPNLLFYAPSRDARDVTDPRGPDFPYTLVGWAYGAPYEPARIPGLVPCMGLRDWHIHERGVHPVDSGGMTVMPPTETSYGEASGTFLDPPAMEPVIGFPHPRSWTVHLWLERNGVPKSAILDPRDPPPGIDPGVGSSFFFPERPEVGVKAAAQASGAKAYVIKAGKGESVRLRDSTYTFKAGSGGKIDTGGAFTMIEIVLRRGSEPPMHIHHRETEAFYILSGEMTFLVAGQVTTAQTGDFLLLPRGHAHAYRVDGNGVARVLLMSSPPGIEHFFRAAAPNPGDPNLALEHGIEAVGPPLRALTPP